MNNELATRHSDNTVIDVTLTEDEAFDEGFRQGWQQGKRWSKFTCQQLIRWTVDITGREFAKEIYGRELEDDAGGYAIGKFKQMQNDLITWMASLDGHNKERLARSIFSHSDEDGYIKEDSPLNWGKK